MSFSVSYNGLATKNIRHIYSTRQSINVKQFRRHKMHYPSPLSHEIALKRRPDVRKRTMAYIPEYETVLPRAPAFRTLPGYNLERMVSRLTKPNKTKQNPRECEHYKKSYHRYEFDLGNQRDDFKRTKSDVRKITDRLIEPILCNKHHHYSKHQRDVDDLTPVYM